MSIVFTLFLAAIAIGLVALVCHLHYSNLRLLRLKQENVVKVLVEDVVDRLEDSEEQRDPDKAYRLVREAKASLLTAITMAGGVMNLTKLSNGIDVIGIETAISDKIKDLKKQTKKKKRKDDTQEGDYY